VADPRIVNFFQRIAARPFPREPWERMDALLLRKDYCRLWLGVHSRDIVRIAAKPHPGACDQYLGSLMVAETLIDKGLVRIHPKLVRSQLEAAIRLRSQALTKRDLATPARLAGEIALQEGETARARQHFKTALAIWPDPRNPAATQLHDLEAAP